MSAVYDEADPVIEVILAKYDVGGVELAAYPPGTVRDSIAGQMCRLLAAGASIREAARANLHAPEGVEDGDFDMTMLMGEAARDVGKLNNMGVRTPGATDVDVRDALRAQRDLIDPDGSVYIWPEDAS